MMFGQLANRESLRDFIVALEVHHSKCYHLGMGKNISKSSLARANKDRDCIKRWEREWGLREIPISCKSAQKLLLMG
jgi:hypothetical protein